jgi:hypothetical protein
VDSPIKRPLAVRLEQYACLKLSLDNPEYFSIGIVATSHTHYGTFAAVGVGAALRLADGIVERIGDLIVSTALIVTREIWES